MGRAVAESRYPDNATLDILEGVPRANGSTRPPPTMHMTVIPRQRLPAVPVYCERDNKDRVLSGHDRPLPWIHSSLWLMT